MTEWTVALFGLLGVVGTAIVAWIGNQLRLLIEQLRDLAKLAEDVPVLKALVSLLAHEVWAARSRLEVAAARVENGGHLTVADLDPGPLSPLLRSMVEGGIDDTLARIRETGGLT